METAGSFETSVPVYSTTLHHVLQVLALTEVRTSDHTKLLSDEYAIS